MRKVHPSFPQRLYLYVLSITVLIFGCIAVVFDSYCRQREEKQAILYTFALQGDLLQKLENELVSVESAVDLTAKQMMNTPYVEHSKLVNFMQLLVQNNSSILGVGFISYKDDEEQDAPTPLEYIYKDKHGIFQHRHLPRTQYRYQGEPWYINAVNYNEGQWTEPYLDKWGSHDRMVSYAIAIRDSHKRLRGVVVADVALEQLASDVDNIKPFKDSYSFTLSKKGVVITHPQTRFIMRNTVFSMGRILQENDYNEIGKNMLAGKKGVVHCKLQGTDVLVCYAPLPHVGWSVCSVCPYSTIMSELGSITYTILIILVIGLLLLVVCVHFIVVRTSEPIHQMTEAAYLIAQGNFHVTLPEVKTKDELRKLHDAFAFMQQSIRTYIQDLEQTTRAKERIESELNVAHRIQMSIVPNENSLRQANKYIDIDAILKPAREVGGDFYDYLIKDNQLYFAIGDVSGKGIAASLVMSITCTLLRSIMQWHSSPGEIVTLLNEALSQNNQANMFVTLFLGRLDLETGRLTYCNAGHNPPYLFSVDDGCQKLAVVPNLSLGIYDSFNYQEQSVDLQKHQSLLLYTDGLTEAENPTKLQMGKQRVENVLATNAGRSAHDILTVLQQEMDKFVDGARQSDDLTLLAVCYEQKDNNTLVLKNRLEELEKLQPFVENIGKNLSLPTSLVSSINLALEEAIVNIINYAYPEGKMGDIRLKASFDSEPSRILFELTDSGIPFDPTSVKEADVTLGIEERPVGGLGIFMMRKLMDEVTYKRQEEKNILLMIKKF